MGLLGGLFGQGIAGGPSSAGLNYPPPPPVNHGLLHSQHLAGAQQAQAQFPPTSYERTVFGVSPIEFKAQQAITTVVQQLPMRIATSIARISYAHTENNNGSPTNAAFCVVFTNAHSIKFYNVDTFPLEEDIARIALECP